MKKNIKIELLDKDFLFSNLKKLNLKELSQQYNEAEPFPSTVLDNVFPDEVLEIILDEFPHTSKLSRKFDSDKEIKFASGHESEIPIFTNHFLYTLNSQTFLDFIEKLTGIENLIPDLTFEGGGVHQIKKGGKLSIHADFNLHSKYSLDRRLNLLVYLNKNWKEEYGGSFEMWDKEMKECEKKVLPIFNRMVIFSTTSDSFHGHPDELKCPDNFTRKSLALYYYTNGRPKEENTQGYHTTLFKNRPDEVFSMTKGQKIRKKIRKLLPKKLKSKI